jgi:hypothetical protein
MNSSMLHQGLEMPIVEWRASICWPAQSGGLGSKSFQKRLLEFQSAPADAQDAVDHLKAINQAECSTRTPLELDPAFNAVGKWGGQRMAATHTWTTINLSCSN